MREEKNLPPRKSDFIGNCPALMFRSVASESLFICNKTFLGKTEIILQLLKQNIPTLWSQVYFLLEWGLLWEGKWQTANMSFLGRGKQDSSSVSRGLWNFSPWNLQIMEPLIQLEENSLLDQGSGSVFRLIALSMTTFSLTLSCYSISAWKEERRKEKKRRVH